MESVKRQDSLILTRASYSTKFKPNSESTKILERNQSVILPLSSKNLSNLRASFMGSTKIKPDRPEEDVVVPLKVIKIHDSFRLTKDNLWKSSKKEPAMETTYESDHTHRKLSIMSGTNSIKSTEYNSTGMCGCFQGIFQSRRTRVIKVYSKKETH